MTCREVRDNLSFYLDGVLDESTQEALEAHIKLCKDCRNELASLTALVYTTRNIEDAEPPVGLRESIMAAVHEEEAVYSTKQPFSISFGCWLRGLLSLRATRWAAGAVAAGAALYAVIGIPEHQQQQLHRASIESNRPSQTASATVSPKPVEHATQAKVVTEPPARQPAKVASMRVQETHKIRAPKASYQVRTVASAPAPAPKRVIHKSTKTQIAKAPKHTQPNVSAASEQQPVETASAPTSEPSRPPVSNENVRIASVKVSNGPIISKEETEKWMADAKEKAAMHKGREQMGRVSFVTARF